ncbi:MAG: GNAT family N-acetyltransferase [Rhodovarius sp.]|nr:GNAT family N-acetyltransferase [Rhodovarius sp.]MCX7933244.1 GNAT family N-acetyltransferase [Rhodovarius sp.]MDW8315237.1 GNAT family N-acetyltransferase [Rhodovarius sp.]
MIRIRRALPQDAAGMGLAHVSAWRSAYAGILPAHYLAGLSAVREAAAYERAISRRAHGHAAFVATIDAEDAPPGTRLPPGGLVVGFSTGGRARRPNLADGEIETLYVVDDWRDRGIGRRLLRAQAAHLRALHCRSVLVWVLAENPARWFYERLGARTVAWEEIVIAGRPVIQQAMLWERVDSLLAATAGTHG